MIERGTGWRGEIEQQFDADTASEYVKMIEELLQDDAGNVVRHLTSELIISLRETRGQVLKVQEDSSAEVKATVLYHVGSTGEVTVDSFNQMLLNQIAEARQLLDCLRFYAMALSERKMLSE